MAELRRVHILPIEKSVPERNRLSTIAPELKRIRSEGSRLSSGKILESQGQKFVVVECDPKEAKIGADTEFFTEGSAVPIFSKLQINALPSGRANAPSNLDNESLFAEYVKPFFHSLNSSKDQTKLLEVNQKIHIFGLLFEVKATEPSGVMGIVHSNTVIYAEWDAPPAQMGGYGNYVSEEEEMLRQAMALSRGGGYGGGYGGYSVPPPAARGAQDFDDAQLAAAMALSRETYSGPPAGSPGAPYAQDPELAAAIAASYSTSTTQGREETEEEMIQRAIRQSQVEEESRQRKSLREQQDAEVQESMLMDQMRAKEEQQKRQKEQDDEKARLEEKKRKEEEESKQRKQAAAQLEVKQSRLTAEPPTGESGRLQLVLRLPSGKRLQRAFRTSETIGLIYDYVDIQQLEELEGKTYALISNMPRKVYEDRTVSLQSAGISNQFVLLVEVKAAAVTNL